MCTLWSLALAKKSCNNINNSRAQVSRLCYFLWLWSDNYFFSTLFSVQNLNETFSRMMSRRKYHFSHQKLCIDEIAMHCPPQKVFLVSLQYENLFTLVTLLLSYQHQSSKPESISLIKVNILQEYQSAVLTLTYCFELNVFEVEVFGKKKSRFSEIASFRS